jgi:hypothetical protein
MQSKPPLVPKFTSSKSGIYVNDPEFLCRLIDGEVYLPKITPLKIEKTQERGGVIMYQLSLEEVNTGLEKEVHFVLPEAFSDSIVLDPPDEETSTELIRHNDESKRLFTWTTSSPEEAAYKELLNNCLMRWGRAIQANNNYGELPSIQLLVDKTKLKWPWRTMTHQEYADSFIKEFHRHQIGVGPGFYSLERNIVGISLRIGSNFGRTLKGQEEELLKKKRKRGKDAAPEPSEMKEEGEESKVE